MHPDTSTVPLIDINPKFPEHEQDLKCPRCDSSNTKFCYYNNYNLSQPRHFCKNCRRYWTKGGTLRNVPIGGGTRKINKRSSIKNKRTSSSATAIAPPSPSPSLPTQMPSKSEPTVGYGFGNYQQMESGGGSFSSLLMDGLSSNLVSSKSADEDVLIRNPIGDDFRSSFLRLNDNNNNRNSGSERGESSSWIGGQNENGWPDLSIFTPGSSFH